MLTPSEFYKDPAVRQRIKEYCGWNNCSQTGKIEREENITAEYLVGYGEALKHRDEPFLSVSKRNFEWILDSGLDIFRSVWDSESTLGILDIEYFNLRYPAEIHYRPKEVFEKIEPIYKIIQKIFLQFGLVPLVIMTGQGYHFAFRVDRKSLTHKKMESLGKVCGTLWEKYRAVHGRRTHPVEKDCAQGFEGMGRLLEYVVHLTVRLHSKEKNIIPVVCTDVSVGGKGEAVSLDLSIYGDSIYMRDIRCPFSSYQKHKVAKYKYGESTAREIPVQIAIPRVTNDGKNQQTLNQIFSMRRHFRNAVQYASSITTGIPEASSAVEKLMNAYRQDPLFAFHNEFDKVEHEPPQKWPLTYDSFDLKVLPPCVSHCLTVPNDHLLKPTNLQTLVRVLMKLGWHPKHIAGLVRSKFERNYNWGTQWFKYDAASRANFYVRLFAGLLSTGADQEIDLNCISHQEKRHCWKPFCGFNLKNYRLVKS